MRDSSLTTSLRAAVFAALVSVVSLAGCGGAGEGGSTAVDGVSRQEFVANADAICAETTERRNAIIAATAPLTTEGPKQDDAAREYASTMRPVLREALQRLWALERPRGDEKTITGMLAKFEQAFALIDDLASASDEGENHWWRPWTAWAELAVEGQNDAYDYGLKECSRFGTP